MTTITISLVGIPELRAKLEQAAASLARPTALMEAIAAQMENNVQFRFDARKAPDGSAWSPLAASTKRRYAAEDAKSGGKKQGTLLQRTGHLRASLSSRGHDDYAEIGFTRTVGGWDLGALHEFGTQTMPRRQLLTDDPVAGTLGQGDLEDINGVVQLFVDGLL
jgi:phage virion morphogenesis protein